MKTKKKSSNLFLTIMGDEKRQSITIPLFAIFLSLIAGALLIILLNVLGIPLENMAAFGDGINDLPMLEIVGFGCTMANAKEEVQKAVAHIAPSNREDGVAQVLEQLLEQGLIGKGV